MTAADAKKAGIIILIFLVPEGVKCPRVKNVKLKASGGVILLGWSRQ